MSPVTLTAAQAVEMIHPGDAIFIHSVSATPRLVVEAMVDAAESLKRVKIIHMHTEGQAPYAAIELAHIFNIDAFFVGQNIRKSVYEGHADYIPAFLSEIPRLIRQRHVPTDVALISVTPPDKHGYVSMGPSVDASLAAVESARLVIAQVNPKMPRVFGDGILKLSDIDVLVEGEAELPEVLPPPISPEVDRIGRFIAEVVPDGATLQMGIGSIPNAVLGHLHNHKDLGIHTELFSDGVLPLIEKGVVTNARKKVYPGSIVSTIALGSKKLYNFLDDNPRMLMLDATFTNNANIIAKNPRVTAINSAIEIDLTGQVCADSIGTLMYSGVGGQIDFIRGASASEGGKPIIAITSRTGKGKAKIVPKLTPGAGVVTTRPSVHFVATEYGIVNLYGLSLKERAAALISIAHPDDRETLEKAAFERWKGNFDEMM